MYIYIFNLTYACAFTRGHFCRMQAECDGSIPTRHATLNERRINQLFYRSFNERIESIKTKIKLPRALLLPSNVTPYNLFGRITTGLTFGLAFCRHVNFRNIISLELYGGLQAKL